jgi:proline iminopeptidase
VRAHFGLARVALVGESWGCGLAALYAAQHPDRVSRIVFLGPMPPTKELSKQRLDAVNAQMDLYRRLGELRKEMATTPHPREVCREFFAAYLRPYFVDPAAMARRRGDSCNTAEAGIRAYFAVNEATIAALGDWDFRPLLHALPMPALVIDGEESKPTVASARAWAAALAHGRLVLVPHAGHFPQVEQPELFFSAVREFLRGD